MGKKLLVGWLMLGVVLLVPTTVSHAQTITTTDTRVLDYELPYPGLLPDSPLYAIKSIRDSLVMLVTQGDLEKAKIYLELSDKEIAMADPLAKKGKIKLAVKMITESQESFTKVVSHVEKAEASKEKTDFISEIKKANLKHREAMETLMKDIPQGEMEEIQSLITANIEMEKQLQKLK